MKGTTGGSGKRERLLRQRRFVAFVLTFAMVAELVPAQALRAMLPAPVADALVRTEAQAAEVNGTSSYLGTVLGASDAELTADLTVDSNNNVSGISADRTIDLQNHTLTLTGSSAGIAVAANTLTIKNGTVKVTGTSGLSVSGTGAVKLENVTFEVSSYQGVSVQGGSLGVSNGTLAASASGAINIASGATLALTNVALSSSGGSVISNSGLITINGAYNGVTIPSNSSYPIANTSSGTVTVGTTTSSASETIIASETPFTGGTVTVNSGTFAAWDSTYQLGGTTTGYTATPTRSGNNYAYGANDNDCFLSANVPTVTAEYEEGVDKSVGTIYVFNRTNVLVDSKNYTAVYYKAGTTTAPDHVDSNGYPIDAGTYDVHLIGAGDYADCFDINAGAKLTITATSTEAGTIKSGDKEVTPSNFFYTYNGTPQMPEDLHLFDADGKEITSGFSFVVTGNDKVTASGATQDDYKTAAGTVTIGVVMDDPNYTNPTTAQYEIEALDLSGDNVVVTLPVKSQVVVGSRVSISPDAVSVTTVGKDGKTYTIPSTDYDYNMTYSGRTQQVNSTTGVKSIGTLDSVGAVLSITVSATSTNNLTSTYVQKVTVSDPVATIGTDKYASVQDAVDKVTDSATIELAADATNESVVIDNGQDVTLKLDTHALTNKSDDAVITVKNGGTLTLNAQQAGSLSNTGTGPAIQVEEGGNLVVACNKEAVISSANGPVLLNAGNVTIGANSSSGTLTAGGGSAPLFGNVEAEAESNTAGLLAATASDATGTIAISAGTFNGVLINPDLKTTTVELSGGTFNAPSATTVDAFMPAIDGSTSGYSYGTAMGPKGSGKAYSVAGSIASPDFTTWTGLNYTTQTTDQHTNASITATTKDGRPTIKLGTDFEVSGYLDQYGKSLDPTAPTTVGSYSVILTGKSGTTYAGTTVTKNFTVGEAVVKLEAYTGSSTAANGYYSNIRDAYTALQSLDLTSSQTIFLDLLKDTTGSIAVPANLHLYPRLSGHTLTGDNGSPAFTVEEGGELAFTDGTGAKGTIVAGANATTAILNNGTLTFKMSSTNATDKKVTIQGGLVTNNANVTWPAAGSLELDGQDNSALVINGAWTLQITKDTAKTFTNNSASNATIVVNNAGASLFFDDGAEATVTNAAGPALDVQAGQAVVYDDTVDDNGNATMTATFTGTGISGGSNVHLRGGEYKGFKPTSEMATIEAGLSAKAKAENNYILGDVLTITRDGKTSYLLSEVTAAGGGARFWGDVLIPSVTVLKGTVDATYKTDYDMGLYTLNDDGSYTQYAAANLDAEHVTESETFYLGVIGWNSSEKAIASGVGAGDYSYSNEYFKITIGPAIATLRAVDGEEKSIGYATVQEAINAIPEGSSGTVRLDKAQTESVTITGGRDVTLNLYGNTLTGDATAPTIIVVSGAKVTLSNQTYGGTVVAGTGQAAVSNAGEFRVVTTNSGTAEWAVTGDITSSGETNIGDAGKVTVTGAITVTDGKTTIGKDASINSGTASALTVSGGSVEITDAATVKNNSADNATVVTSGTGAVTVKSGANAIITNDRKDEEGASTGTALNATAGTITVEADVKGSADGTTETAFSAKVTGALASAAATNLIISGGAYVTYEPTRDVATLPTNQFAKKNTDNDVNAYVIGGKITEVQIDTDKASYVLPEEPSGKGEEIRKRFYEAIEVTIPGVDKPTLFTDYTVKAYLGYKAADGTITYDTTPLTVTTDFESENYFKIDVVGFNSKLDLADVSDGAGPTDYSYSGDDLYVEVVVGAAVAKYNGTTYAKLAAAIDDAETAIAKDAADATITTAKTHTITLLSGVAENVTISALPEGAVEGTGIELATGTNALTGNITNNGVLTITGGAASMTTTVVTGTITNNVNAQLKLAGKGTVTLPASSEAVAVLTNNGTATVTADARVYNTDGVAVANEGTFYLKDSTGAYVVGTGAPALTNGSDGTVEASNGCIATYAVGDAAVIKNDGDITLSGTVNVQARTEAATATRDQSKWTGKLFADGTEADATIAITGGSFAGDPTGLTKNTVTLSGGTFTLAGRTDATTAFLPAVGADAHYLYTDYMGPRITSATVNTVGYSLASSDVLVSVPSPILSTTKATDHNITVALKDDDSKTYAKDTDFEVTYYTSEKNTDGELVPTTTSATLPTNAEGTYFAKVSGKAGKDFAGSERYVQFSVGTALVSLEDALNADGTAVKEDGATVNGDYASITEALSKIPAGGSGTIRLKEDVDGETATVSDGKQVVLLLTKHTLTGVDGAPAIKVEGATTTLSVGKTTASNGGTIAAGKDSATAIENAGTLTFVAGATDIKVSGGITTSGDVTLNGKTAVDAGTATALAASGDAEVSVEGATVTNSSSSNATITTAGTATVEISDKAAITNDSTVSDEDETLNGTAISAGTGTTVTVAGDTKASGTTSAFGAKIKGLVSGGADVVTLHGGEYTYASDPVTGNATLATKPATEGATGTTLYAKETSTKGTYVLGAQIGDIVLDKTSYVPAKDDSGSVTSPYATIRDSIEVYDASDTKHETKLVWKTNYKVDVYVTDENGTVTIDGIDGKLSHVTAGSQLANAGTYYFVISGIDADKSSSTPTEGDGVGAEDYSLSGGFVKVTIGDAVASVNFGGTTGIEYYATVQAAIEAAQTAGGELTVTMLANNPTTETAISVAAVSGSKVTLDTNGKTLKANIENEGELTIATSSDATDSVVGNITNEGTLALAGSGRLSSSVGATITNKGTLTIGENETVRILSTGGAAIKNESGSVTIDGAAILASAIDEAGKGVAAVDNAATFTMNAGRILANNLASTAAAIVNSGELTLDGAEVAARTDDASNNSGATAQLFADGEGADDDSSITIKGGTFFGTVIDETNLTKNTVTLSGGTFTLAGSAKDFMPGIDDKSDNFTYTANLGPVVKTANTVYEVKPHVGSPNVDWTPTFLSSMTKATVVGTYNDNPINASYYTVDSNYYAEDDTKHETALSKDDLEVGKTYLVKITGKGTYGGETYVSFPYASGLVRIYESDAAALKNTDYSTMTEAIAALTENKQTTATLALVGNYTSDVAEDVTIPEGYSIKLVSLGANYDFYGSIDVAKDATLELGGGNYSPVYNADITNTKGGAVTITNTNADVAINGTLTTSTAVDLPANLTISAGDASALVVTGEADVTISKDATLVNASKDHATVSNQGTGTVTFKEGATATVSNGTVKTTIVDDQSVTTHTSAGPIFSGTVTVEKDGDSAYTVISNAGYVTGASVTLSGGVYYEKPDDTVKYADEDKSPKQLSSGVTYPSYWVIGDTFAKNGITGFALDKDTYYITYGSFDQGDRQDDMATAVKAGLSVQGIDVSVTSIADVKFYLLDKDGKPTGSVLDKLDNVADGDSYQIVIEGKSGASYTIDGKTYSKNFAGEKDTSLTVTFKKAVAEVFVPGATPVRTGFGSLADAAAYGVELAAAGTTGVVAFPLVDVTTATTVNAAPEGADASKAMALTIYTAGHNLTLGSDEAAITVKGGTVPVTITNGSNNADSTIKNSGAVLAATDGAKVTIADGSKTVSYVSSASNAIVTEGEGTKVTVNSGSLTSTGASVLSIGTGSEVELAGGMLVAGKLGSDLAAITNDGTLTVSGTATVGAATLDYYGDHTDPNKYVLDGTLFSGTGAATIKAGTFNGYLPLDLAADANSVKLLGGTFVSPVETTVDAYMPSVSNAADAYAYDVLCGPKVATDDTTKKQYTVGGSLLATTDGFSIVATGSLNSSQQASEYMTNQLKVTYTWPERDSNNRELATLTASYGSGFYDVYYRAEGADATWTLLADATTLDEGVYDIRLVGKNVSGVSGDPTVTSADADAVAAYGAHAPKPDFSGTEKVFASALTVTGVVAQTMGDSKYFTTLQEAIDNVKDISASARDRNIVLLVADIPGQSATIAKGQTIVLSMNDHKLTGASNADAALIVEDGGSLTIGQDTWSKDGTINAADGKLAIISAGDLTVGAASGTCTVGINGTVSVTGGKTTLKPTTTVNGASNSALAVFGGEVVVNGATLINSSKDTPTVSVSDGEVSVTAASKAKIENVELDETTRAPKTDTSGVVIPTGGKAIAVTGGKMTIAVDTKDTLNLTAVVVGPVSGGANLILNGGAYSETPAGNATLPTKAANGTGSNLVAKRTTTALDGTTVPAGYYIIGDAIASATLDDTLVRNGTYVLTYDADGNVIPPWGQLVAAFTVMGINDGKNALAPSTHYLIDPYTTGDNPQKIDGSALSNPGTYTLKVSGVDSTAGTQAQYGNGISAGDYTFSTESVTLTIAEPVAQVEVDGTTTIGYETIDEAIAAATKILAATEDPNTTVTVKLVANDKDGAPDTLANQAIAIATAGDYADGSKLVFDLNGRTLEGADVISVTGNGFAVEVTDSAANPGGINATGTAVSSDNAGKDKNVTITGGIYTTEVKDAKAYNKNVVIGLTIDDNGNVVSTPYFKSEVARTECDDNVKPYIGTKTVDGDDYYTVEKGYANVELVTTNERTGKETRVAYYDTLTEGFAAIVADADNALPIKVTLRLLTDLPAESATTGETWSAKHDVTVDLNGNTLANQGKNAATLIVATGTNLTVSIVNNGKTAGTIASVVPNCRAIRNTGVLTLGEGVNVVAADNATSAAIVNNDASSKLTIDGATVVGSPVSTEGAIAVTSGQATITSGSVTSSGAASGIKVDATSTLTVNGGTITSNGQGAAIDSAGTLAITGGTITAASDADDVNTVTAVKLSGTGKTTTISGGTISASTNVPQYITPVKAIDLTAGTLNISGGEISSTETGIATVANSTLKVVEPEDEDGTAASITTAGANVAGVGTITIAAGNFTVTGDAASNVDVSNNTTTVTINGGTFVATAANVDTSTYTTGSGTSVTISGGTFYSDTNNVIVGQSAGFTSSGGVFYAGGATPEDPASTISPVVAASGAKPYSVEFKFDASDGYAGGYYSYEVTDKDVDKTITFTRTAPSGTSALGFVQINDESAEHDDMYIIGRVLSKLELNDLTTTYNAGDPVSIPTFTHTTNNYVLTEGEQYYGNDDKPFKVEQVTYDEDDEIATRTELDGIESITELGDYLITIYGKRAFEYSTGTIHLTVEPQTVTVTKPTAVPAADGTPTTYYYPNVMPAPVLTYTDGEGKTHAFSDEYFDVEYAGYEKGATADATMVITLSNPDYQLDATDDNYSTSDDGTPYIKRTYKIAYRDLGSAVDTDGKVLYEEATLKVDPQQPYTGEALTLDQIEVTIEDGGETFILAGVPEDYYNDLIAKRRYAEASQFDYVYSIANDDGTDDNVIAVGARGQVIVKGVNRYALDTDNHTLESQNTLTKPFRIVPAELKAMNWASGEEPSYVYDGTEKMPEVVVYDENDKLVPADQYTVGYSDNVNATTGEAPANVVVSANDDSSYKGGLTLAFAIDPYDLSGEQVSVAAPKNVEYDGTAQKSKPTLTFVTGDGNEVTLVEDVDYTLDFGDDHASVGPVTVTISGTGNFAGETTTSFEIVKGLVTPPVAVEGLVYDGTAQTGVKAASDLYLLADNTATVAGTHTAKATLADASNYTWDDGTVEPKEIDFQIAKANLADAVVADIDDQTYTGSALAPELEVTGVGDEKLAAGTDYVASYEDNVGVGTATVTLTAAEGSNYTGTKVVTFDITQATLEGASIAVADQPYTGEAVEPPVVVTWNEQTLVGDVDYEVRYENNVDAGTATVTITGKGNFAAEPAVSEDFEITQGVVGVPSIDDVTYDGTAHSVLSATDYYTLAIADAGTTDAAVVDGAVVVTTAGTVTVAATLTDAKNYAWGEGDPAAITFTVKKASVNVPEGLALVYNGSEQAGVASSDLYALTNEKATEAGTHKATASLVDAANYAWADGTAEDKDVEFVIAKAQVAKPTAISGLTYNRLEQTGVATGEGYALSGNTGTAAKGYVATATLDANHEWADGTTDAVEVPWSIARASLETPVAAVVAPVDSQTYTGSAITPTGLVVTLDGVLLAEGTDYTLSYDNNTNVTTEDSPAKITVTGTGNYTGSASATFAIAPATATLPANLTVTYDGETHTIEGNATVDMKAISASDVSSVSVKTKPTAGYVFASDVEVDEDGAATVTLTITRASIAEATVSVAEGSAYTGQEQKPAVTVELGKLTLKEGTDFTVTYANNVDAGTATAYVRAADGSNFSGATTADFTIARAVATAPKAAEGLVYNGAEQEGVAKGTGYVVEGGKATDAGKHEATASLESDNYVWDDGTTADKTYTYSIAAADLSSAAVSGVSASYAFTGSAIKPTPTVTLAGRTLVAGTDYDVAYGANTAQGSTGTVTVTGKGNYAGSVGKTFAISTVSKAALNAAISSANSDLAGTKSSSRSGSDVAANNAWTTPAARTTAQAAITAAQRVANNANATQAQVDAAAKAVNDARAVFDSAKRAGTYRPTFSRLNAHIQTYGWRASGWDGSYQGLPILGTTGQSKRVEAMEIGIANAGVVSGGVTMQAHVQTYGDLPAVSAAVGSYGWIGTTGESKRMESIRLTLTGEISQGYSIWYRAHVQTFGWLGWAKDGARAGSTGLSKRMESIEVVILPKGETPTGYNASATPVRTK